MGFSIIIPILPDLAVDLGGSKESIWVAALYALMNFLFAPLWGNLSDRVGRRPVILWSIVITALSQFLLAFVISFPLLMLQRALAGIGSANISAANAYMADISNKENRARNMGLVGAAFGMGFIIGPVLGGFLYDAFGLMGVGYGSGILSCLNLVLAYFLLPESLKEKQPDLSKRINPFSPLKQAMKRVEVRRLYTLNFLSIMAFAMMQVTAALMWEEHFLLNKKEIGLVFSFIGLSSALVQFGLVGIMNRLLGEKKLVVIGLILMMLSLVALPLVPGIWMELFPLAGLALATGCLNPSLLSLLSAQVSPKEQGNILGSNQSIGSLGRMAGPFLGGFLYAVDFRVPYLFGGFILLLALLFTFDTYRKYTLRA